LFWYNFPHLGFVFEAEDRKTQKKGCPQENLKGWKPAQQGVRNLIYD
jgi:hypothetical protein